MLVSCGSVVANRSTSSAKRKLVMRLAFVWPSCMPDARVVQRGLSVRKMSSRSALKSRELRGSPCLTPR